MTTEEPITCVALLQNALMLPEFAESKRWEQEAVLRWQEVLKVQFHQDGSHVSLSTGYNWASIMALENMVALFHRVGREVPQQFLDVLEKGLPSTPSRCLVPIKGRST